MSWLSELFSGSDQPHQLTPLSQYTAEDWLDTEHNTPDYYATIKQFDPKVVAAQKAVEATSAPAPSAAAAYAGPGALQEFNDALGPGFENRFEPDTVASPFVQGALTSGRSKADDFIANMLKRGTLSETGRQGAVSALDKQTPDVQTRLQNVGTGLLSSDRASLTSLADSLRGSVGGTSGEGFDPSPLVSQIASLGQSQSSTFGDRFNKGLPPGDLFDTSGIAGASGAVVGPNNVSYDPYAQEGGQLSTGLSDSSQGESPSGGQKKRRTSIF